MHIRELKRGQLYSEELEINLKKNSDSELFKWLLASVLFGARISETTAKNTYKSFVHYKLLTPRKIIKAGWRFLVSKVMAKGGYARYDESTSAQLLDMCKVFLKKYRGSLKNLHREAENNKDLENKLIELKGVGPVTANIFLRELRTVWRKADPEPLPIVKKLARKYKVNLKRYKRKSIEFVRIEASLIRLRHG